jgi:hypothetical protein
MHRANYLIIVSATIDFFSVVLVPAASKKTTITG